MSKTTMTKKEFADLIEVRTQADTVSALIQTAQIMEANEDLTADNLVSLLLGIYEMSVDKYNGLVDKHGINEKSMDDIEVR